MDKIYRPPLRDVDLLVEYESTLELYCQECRENSRNWASSGSLYLKLREALSNITNGHCSFCDFFPLNDGTKETIEHYYPKKEFKEKTYLWENLFYCCDKCQSEANKNIFEYTIKPDDSDYQFNDIFYFNPIDGEIKVLENLESTNNDLFIRAIKFLDRYGINKSKQSLYAKKKLYQDLLFKLKHNYTINRDDEPRRFIYDEAIRYYNEFILKQ